MVRLHQDYYHDNQSRFFSSTKSTRQIIPQLTFERDSGYRLSVAHAQANFHYFPVEEF